MKLRYLLLVFALAFAGFAVARLPLSVVMARAVPDDVPFSYARAEGTVWEGRLHDLRLRGVPLGNATLELAPLSLLRLAPALDWRLSGGAVTGHGQFTSRLFQQSFTMREADIAADLERLPTMVPLTGVFVASVREFAWEGNACQAADVELRTSALNRNPMGLDWRGPTLTGDVACEGGVLTVRLAGADGSSDLDMEGAITPDMAYRLAVLLKTDNADLRRSLTMLGHAEGKDGFNINFEGMIGVDPSSL